MDDRRGPRSELTLDEIREVLIRLEDSIVFALIERAALPRNYAVYGPSDSHGGGSLLEVFVRDAESAFAKVGKYQRPEDVPFFPQDLPPLRADCAASGGGGLDMELHPLASLVTVNADIWRMYVEELLPLVTTEGSGGDYALMVAADLACLQALSRRIHVGKYVAEAKYRAAPYVCQRAIIFKDENALTKLLTKPAVEEKVIKRVEKKVRVFGQNVTDEEDDGPGQEPTYKLDPSVVSRLYKQWVIPLTKQVEIKYLLRHLDP